MKMFKLTSLLCLILLFCVQLKAQNNVAPDVSFTDIEGNSHNVYGYLNDGYKVILVYGGYEEACWIGEWQTAAGSEIWNEHGPNGDNTVRMFFIDESDMIGSTDESVANYTAEMGVEYPVVNLNQHLSGYPAEDIPAFYTICLDKSYHFSSGFSEEGSYEQMKAFLLECDGVDLSNDVYFSGFKDKPQFCTKGDEHSIIPVLHLMLSDQNTTTEDLNQPYTIYYYLNGNIQDTFNMPASVGQYGLHADRPTLPKITLNSGDTIRYVLDYPNDTYSGNNTYQYIVPLDLEDSPTSTTSIQKFLLGSNGVEFSLNSPLDNGAEHLYDYTDTTQITLSNGSCYAVKFINNLFSNISMNNENDIPVIEVGSHDFFPINSTPWLYFNVDSDTTSSIKNQNLAKKTIRTVNYFDISGKKISAQAIQPFILYIRVIRYEDGSIETKKFLRNY